MLHLGCVQPSVTVAIHVYTQSSTREEAGCWQGLEYSSFQFFTPEGSSVQGVAVGGPLSPWSHSPVLQPVPALMPLGWDCNAVTEGSFFPVVFYWSGAAKRSVWGYLPVQAEPLCGIFRSADVS